MDFVAEGFELLVVRHFASLQTFQGLFEVYSDEENGQRIFVMLNPSAVVLDVASADIGTPPLCPLPLWNSVSSHFSPPKRSGPRIAPGPG
jgi:hypothetical protein